MSIAPEHPGEMTLMGNDQCLGRCHRLEVTSVNWWLRKSHDGWRGEKSLWSACNWSDRGSKENQRIISPDGKLNRPSYHHHHHLHHHHLLFWRGVLYRDATQWICSKPQETENMLISILKKKYSAVVMTPPIKQAVWSVSRWSTVAFLSPRTQDK